MVQTGGSEFGLGKRIHFRMTWRALRPASWPVARENGKEMKKKGFAIAAGFAVAASLVVHAAHAHTGAWYSDHIDEAKKRQVECRTKEKADIELSPEEKKDCDNAVVAVMTQPYSKPIPSSKSAPAPKWSNFGH